MTKQTKKSDVYEIITNQIIEAIEANPKRWQSGLNLLSAGIPTRHQTGEAYRGINHLILSMFATINGYSSPYWFTFKQVQELNTRLIDAKGKGVKVVFFQMRKIEDKSTGEEKEIPTYRYYTVFNGDHVENLPSKYQPIDHDGNHIDPILNGELLYQSSACEIKTMDSKTPHYSPTLDYIGIPDITRFDTAENYYTTLAHEIVHSTGHSSRLDRFKKGPESKADYAFEELIAELGAVFVCSQLDIHGELENHAAYLKSWLQHMKNDKRFIFKAASAAQKAADFILERFEKKASKQKAA